MNNFGDVDIIQRHLLDWFKENGRDFPWRQAKDPFHILVAEKLLQQTIARSQLVEAYERILTQYPNPDSLAKAKITDLRKIFKPLGLVYRAAELKAMAREIEEKHNNIVPRDINDLLALTGVGDYSARAILSFAYNEDVPIVDTNVARFLHRVLGIENPIPQNPARSKKLREFAKDLLPEGKSRKFNLAILDFCAAICKPQKPQCSLCVLQPHCEYGKNIAVLIFN